MHLSFKNIHRGWGVSLLFLVALGAVLAIARTPIFDDGSGSLSIVNEAVVTTPPGIMGGVTDAVDPQQEASLGSSTDHSIVAGVREISQGYFYSTGRGPRSYALAVVNGVDVANSIQIHGSNPTIIMGGLFDSVSNSRTYGSGDPLGYFPAGTDNADGTRLSSTWSLAATGIDQVTSSAYYAADAGDNATVLEKVAGFVPSLSAVPVLRGDAGDGTESPLTLTQVCVMATIILVSALAAANARQRCMSGINSGMSSSPFVSNRGIGSRLAAILSIAPLSRQAGSINATA